MKSKFTQPKDYQALEILKLQAIALVSKCRA